MDFGERRAPAPLTAIVPTSESRSWASTRDEQAEEFLSAARMRSRQPAKAEAPARARIAFVDVERGGHEVARRRGVGKLLRLTPPQKLFGHVLWAAIVAPAATFALLLPQAMEPLPWVVRVSSYWLLQQALAIAFGEMIARLCFGDSLSIIWLFGLWVISVVPIVVRDCVKDRETFLVFIYVVIIIGALCGPSTIRLCRGLFIWGPVAPLVANLCAFFCSVTPTILAMVLYIVIAWGHCLDTAVTMLLSMTLWNSASFLIRPIGSALWRRGSPAGKFIVPLLWNFISDVAFGTMGVAVFMRSTTHAVIYAFSIVPVLLFQFARGLIAWRSCKRGLPPTDIKRATIYMEAFASVIGRTVAYTLFVCAVGVPLVAGDSLTTGVFDIVRCFGERSVLDVLIGFGGTCVLWFAFAAFDFAVRRFWETDGHVHPPPEMFQDGGLMCPDGEPTKLNVTPQPHHADAAVAVADVGADAVVGVATGQTEDSPRSEPADQGKCRFGCAASDSQAASCPSSSDEIAPAPIKPAEEQVVSPFSLRGPSWLPLNMLCQFFDVSGGTLATMVGFQMVVSLGAISSSEWLASM